MRKAFTFFACVGILAGALVAAGCKPRNLRQLIMPYVPGPAPVADCSVGTLTLGNGNDEAMATSTTVGASEIQVCGESAPGVVFKLELLESTVIYFGAETHNDNDYIDLLVELRRTCESEGEGIDCAESYDISCCPYTVYADEGCYDLDAGTYYIAVITESPTEVMAYAGYCR